MESPDEKLENLYQEAGPGLLRYFLRRHGSRETAEDLLQETFVQAARQWDRIAPMESPRAYLFGIGRNLSRNWFRNRAALPMERVPEPATDGPLSDRLQCVREAMNALPELMREALELRLDQGLAYEEIARVLDIPIGTVRSRLHQAVHCMREELHRIEKKEKYETKPGS